MRAVPMHSSAQRGAAVSAALVAALLASSALFGCERKAPGPAECQRFAEVVAGMARDDEQTTPPVRAAIDEATQTCLTRPYDRQLITCVESTRRARVCLEAYKKRTGQRL